MARHATNSNLLFATIGFALAGVFAADVVTALGVTVWVFYLAPVALTLYTWKPPAPLWVAFACSGLVILGVVLSPPPPAGFPAWVSWINRTMGVTAIWLVAFVARQSIVSKLRLRDQDWVRAQQMQLGVLMQGEQSTEQLAKRVVRFLCEELNAAVGVIYSADTAGSFEHRGSYAVEQPDSVRPSLLPGQGLAGQAIADKRLLLVNGVPENYLPISSGTGRACPKQLLLAPLLADDSVIGVVELGLLRAARPLELELLKSVCGPIAIAFRSAKYRADLQELLEETQRQAEELQAQQEELRVANEFLEEQGQSLQHSKERLEQQQVELEHSNALLEEQTASLEQQHDQLARTQVELVEKADALERASRYKSEFLANMSHELRTPLNSTLILAKLLADNRDGHLSPEEVRCAATIYSSGNDLLTLINDILDLARIEAGRLEISAEEVSISAVVESLMAMFEMVASQKGIVLHSSIATGVPTSLVTDNLRLQQILRNLLSNALKFTVEGRVTIEISPAAEDTIDFSIVDTGIGIATDELDLVFEAFRQADGSIRREYGGTGLGLTISRELARRLGGSLTVASQVGRGSKFTLRLPTAIDGALVADTWSPPSVPSPRPPQVELVPRRTPKPNPGVTQPRVADDRENLLPLGRTILVVEDDEAFAIILRDLAREQHFQALVATTAAEGLAIAEQFRPSAILLDVHLPDRSGLSLLEQLKRRPFTRHIPVHVVSVADYTQQALELGAIGYALKPVKREQILGAIRRLEQKLDQSLRRVLVVEDNAEQRAAIEALLQHDGVTICSACTGQDAIEQLGCDTFDCMILDLSLPDMSGYDVLDQMARGEAFSFPPVVVYTARDVTPTEEQHLRRYASSVIIKGARSPERLLDEVSLFLHHVEAKLPPEHQHILQSLRHRDAQLEGREVLVVEDDARNIFALSSVLEPKGVKLHIARNGREALAFLERTLDEPSLKVDLVLMDIMMPVMDGLAATRAIRRNPYWEKLPIIALTAKAMPDDRDRCIEAGANDYIAKPLDVERLLSLIKVWLPKQRLAS